MPALDALTPRLHAAHTLAAGVSIDSVHANGAWAASLGGLSVPLLSDFHPKGALASQLGCYVADRGFASRGTVLIDADGIVRHSSNGFAHRDMEAIASLVEEHDAAYAGDLPELSIAHTLPDDVELFVKDNCAFSRKVLTARTNLRLRFPVFNVTRDARAKALLEDLGGKHQAPALRMGDTVLYESADIQAFLVQHEGTLP